MSIGAGGGPPAARPIEALIAQGGAAERYAALVAAILRGRVLLDGPLPLPVLRALLATSHRLVLVGSDRGTLAFQRAFLREHGLEDVDAVHIGPGPDRLPFREPTGAAGGSHLDGALVMAGPAESAAAGGEPGLAGRLEGIARLLGRAPTLAVMSGDGAARAARPVLGTSRPWALVHWGGEVPGAVEVGIAPAARDGLTRPPLRPHRRASDVAILIPTRNRAPLLGRAVASACARTGSPPRSSSSTTDPPTIPAAFSRDGLGT